MRDANELPINGAVPLDSTAPVQTDVITHWAQAWTDFFSSDAAEVDEQVHSLCNKIRTTLATIEEQPPAA